MKRYFLGPLAALALLGFAATAPVAARTGATVHIKNYTFVPATLTVVAGTTVTFVNDDDEPHTATARDKSFDSEAIDTNGTWQHTFAKPGTRRRRGSCSAAGRRS
jgi:plastocyanin